ncbi:MAG: NTP transferase domain-containing protein [Candidatus Nezhaarchaeota archaeon]|nr:NTP transferase domain-containing protein [Candidatus Nezhaarchaeota archaeon]MCX8142280.1 NTP transferase domain-containing protein [Candidatus Nezhaarchaeota archaeon]MDW8050747.1 NTP transferase domain-containing protein [Nitrososphaerota archaeon]
MERDDLISSLKHIGLTEYEGRVYVALIDLGRASAKDISNITSIAYPKVYNVLSNLKDKGFVEEELQRPRLFRPVDPGKAIRAFIEEKVSLLRDEAEKAIKALSSRYDRLRASSAKTFIVQSRRSVITKLRELISSAKREILVSAPDLEVLGVKALLLDLNSARRRGVEVRVLTTPSTSNREVERILEFADVRFRDGLESYYVIADSGSLLISGRLGDLRAIFIADESSIKPTREHFNYMWFEAVPAAIKLGLKRVKRGIIVLAGGMSRRMGEDKTLLPVKGVPMIKRVVDAVLKVSDEVIVVVSGRKMIRKLSHVLGSEVTITEDEKRGWGPIMGIVSGCKRLQAEYVAVVPCDAPFINPRVLIELFKRAEGHEAAIPCWPNGYLEPLHSVYQRDALLKAADELIKKGSRSMLHLIERLSDVIYVPVEELKLIDDRLLTFFNVNTPRDLLIADAMEI